MAHSFRLKFAEGDRDSSVALTHHDTSDLGSMILIGIMPEERILTALLLHQFRPVELWNTETLMKSYHEKISYFRTPLGFGTF